MKVKFLSNYEFKLYLQAMIRLGDKDAIRYRSLWKRAFISPEAPLNSKGASLENYMRKLEMKAQEFYSYSEYVKFDGMSLI